MRRIRVVSEVGHRAPRRTALGCGVSRCIHAQAVLRRYAGQKTPTFDGVDTLQVLDLNGHCEMGRWPSAELPLTQASPPNLKISNASITVGGLSANRFDGDEAEAFAENSSKQIDIRELIKIIFKRALCIMTVIYTFK